MCLYDNFNFFCDIGVIIFFFFFFGCSVACGYGHSLVIVDRTNVGERLDQVIL